MNGAHDMGGVHGFGPVVPEPDEPEFHAEWERRAFALTLAAGSLRKWNLDMSRFSRENTPPADYLSRSYYEMWTYGLEKLLVEQGVVTANELAAARDTAHQFAKVADPPLTADMVEPMLMSGASTRVETEGETPPAMFRVGQTVRAKVMHPTTHTRLPRYVRGHVGTIARDHGVFVFPDTNATSREKKPQRVYAVRFEAHELWGADAGSRSPVFVDLWDDYLVAVEQ